MSILKITPDDNIEFVEDLIATAPDEFKEILGEVRCGLRGLLKKSILSVDERITENVEKWLNLLQVTEELYSLIEAENNEKSN